MKTSIIAFVGPKGCGKSLAATIAGGLVNGRAAYIAFASPLKQMSQKIFELVTGVLPPEKLFEDAWLKENANLLDLSTWGVEIKARRKWISKLASSAFPKLTPRKWLQIVGTDIIRGWDPDFWVRLAESRIEVLKSTHPLILITDARFPNEIAAIRHVGGKVVEIRPRFPTFASNCRDKSSEQHSSETSLSDIKKDAVIHNRSLHQFSHAVETFVLKTLGGDQ